MFQLRLYTHLLIYYLFLHPLLTFKRIWILLLLFEAFFLQQTFYVGTGKHQNSISSSSVNMKANINTIFCTFTFYFTLAAHHCLLMSARRNNPPQQIKINNQLLEQQKQHPAQHRGSENNTVYLNFTAHINTNHCPPLSSSNTFLQCIIILLAAPAVLVNPKTICYYRRTKTSSSLLTSIKELHPPS